MANNRDNKYGEHEETEYHFSDDDVTYEVESEETAAPSKPAPVQSSGGFLANWSTSKRLIVSIISFLVLLFVVYKIVSPGGDGDQIAPVAATDNTSTSTAQQVPVKNTTTPAAAVTADINAAPTVSKMPGAATSPQTSPSPASSTGVGVAEIQNQAQTVVAPINQMPPVMQVTSAPPTYPASSPVVENGANQLVAINNQLVAQMQSDYLQKLANVTQQNKQLEEEIQKLNATVSSVEARMNQLVQLMVRQQADNQQAKETNPVQAATPSAPKLPYTVQAIIPGRAWLRADNGDTLTVTEGDTIKEVGKVTKIDPYDGVIEINTGRKVVSLSYGNGG